MVEVIAVMDSMFYYNGGLVQGCSSDVIIPFVGSHEVNGNFHC